MNANVKAIGISSITIAVLGGILTWLFLLEGTGPILFWAALVAWACFIQGGGDATALKNTIIGNILGIVIGWIAVILIVSIPAADALGSSLWSGIVVGVGLLVLVLLSSIPAFSSIPAGLLGYASVLAYIWQTPGKLSGESVLLVGLTNPLILLVVSMVVGVLVGYAARKVETRILGAEAVKSESQT